MARRTEEATKTWRARCCLASSPSLHRGLLMRVPAWALRTALVAAVGGMHALGGPSGGRVGVQCVGPLGGVRRLG